MSTLRYYADIGLLIPIHIDPFTGYRYYSLEQLPRLNRILALRDLGFTLDQIGPLLEDEITPLDLLLQKQAELQQHIQEEQERRWICSCKNKLSYNSISKRNRNASPALLPISLT